jgi:hypothetical protein
LNSDAQEMSPDVGTREPSGRRTLDVGESNKAQRAPDTSKPIKMR